MLDVTKDGKHVDDAAHDARLLSRQDREPRDLGRFFDGDADSDVGLRAGLTTDIWTVVNPDLAPLQAR